MHDARSHAANRHSTRGGSQTRQPRRVHFKTVTHQDSWMRSTTSCDDSNNGWKAVNEAFISQVIIWSIQEK